MYIHIHFFGNLLKLNLKVIYRILIYLLFFYNYLDSMYMVRGFPFESVELFPSLSLALYSNSFKIHVFFFPNYPKALLLVFTPSVPKKPT